ncbi:MAG: PEP/pyruvate-binding domain-containing protein, partial [Nitrospinales bacterium]
MKAIILGAGQGIVRQNEADSIPKCLIADPFGQRVLDWILDSLRRSGVDEIIFVGGFHLEKVMPNYPDLKYYINPNWDHTHMVESLFCAHPELDGPFLVSYSDVVYRPKIAQDLLKSKADIALAVDRDWKERYAGRMDDLLTEAEKVMVQDNRVVKIGKRIDLKETVWGEFTGLALFNENGARALKKHFEEIKNRFADKPFHEAPNISKAALTDLLQELIYIGTPVEPVAVAGDWAELDAPQDLAQYVFGTKAETLERLKPIVKKARIGDQIIFTIDQWQRNPLGRVREIQNAFQPKRIAVRSSALDEDSWTQSNAGRYCSVLDVDSADEDAIVSSVNRVIQSYQSSQSEPHSSHQVLIQPQVMDAAMSGVLFTRSLESGTPYFVINYDDHSSLTYTVTSGSIEHLKTHYILKNNVRNLDNARLQKLVEMAQELEQVLGYDSLDIEFALTTEEKPSILQVRPIAAHKQSQRIYDEDFLKEIAAIQNFVKNKLLPRPNQFGSTTILGVMPDWNPAEIVGLCPKPLALSLYQYLITDLTWGKSRSTIGYKETFPEPLLISIAGRPYIDTRLSFNSFLPCDLPDGLCEKLVDHYVMRLKERPEFHDKIEFEIALTCYTFDTKNQLKRLRDYGFAERELEALSESLRNLTETIVAGKIAPLSQLRGQIEKLERRCCILLGKAINPDTIPQIVYALLNDCIQFGTLPFGILARYAFIGTSFLKSLVSIGVISQDDNHRFTNSIHTVATAFIRDLSQVQARRLGKEEFLSRYGHLRPGTYDILSPRYDERPELYLSFEEKLPGAAQLPSSESPGFQFSSSQLKQIHERLAEDNLTCSVDELFSFIRSSIEAREWAKFEFTKNLSAALTLLGRFGDHFGFSKNDISFVPIHHFLKLATENRPNTFAKDFHDLIYQGQNKHKMTQALCLPDLIRSPEDIASFSVSANTPNFITQKSVVAETLYLKTVQVRPSLTGKIVLIESADPGCDWVFGHDIKGLVTKYGGAASHMAIR